MKHLSRLLNGRSLALSIGAGTLISLAGCANPPLNDHPGPRWVASTATADGTAGAPLTMSTDPATTSAAAAGAVALASASAASAAALAGTAALGDADNNGPVAAPVDPLHPDRPVDLNDAVATTDLWARVRRGFAIPDLDNNLVRDSEQFYAQRPDYVQRMTERGSRYLYHVVEEVEKRGMPTELALLPFIESAFNPQATSSAKASGMWQFIPSTGKNFDLKQNIFRDDRRDVLASTSAALDYLGRLHDMFGDWHLALAAYNWGEGSVQRAIARNQKLGLPTDYESLRMPDETRGYVPKLQAVKNIVMHPEQYGLTLPPLENHPYFLSVPIERDIDVALAARFAGVSVEEFKQLNPQMNKPVILAACTEQVLLPYDNASRFVHELQAHHGQMATWTAWVAPKTLRAAAVAKEVGMSEARLREVNHIPPRMLVKAGSTLLVPRAETRTADVSEHVADNAVMALAPDVPPLRRLTLRAGHHGDSVRAVASRYRVGVVQVAQWNQVSTGSRFKPGTTIVVYVAQKSSTPHLQVASRGHSTRVAQQTAVASKGRRSNGASHKATARKPSVRVAHKGKTKADHAEQVAQR